MRYIPAARALVTAGIFGLAAGITQPASAVTFSTVGDTATFSGSCSPADSCDTNPPFTLQFEGSIELLSITGVDNNVWTLGIELTNSSFGGTAPFGAELDSFGFDTNPDVLDPGGATIDTLAAGWDTATDVDAFDTVEQNTNITSTSVEICTTVDNCGAASGQGLEISETDLYTLALTLDATNPTSLSLSNLFVKMSGVLNNGTGDGSFNFGGDITIIPVPATLPLFLTGLLGLGFLARRRRQMAEA